jgi:hypothetical protein
LFNKTKNGPSTIRTKIASSRFYTLELLENFEEKRRLYVVINKEFSVVEAESEMLPQAFNYLEELDTSLAAAYDSYTDPDVEFKNITIH